MKEIKNLEKQFNKLFGVIRNPKNIMINKQKNFKFSSFKEVQHKLKKEFERKKKFKHFR